MSRATKPVKVAGIEFDALISEDHTYEATVPEYAVEKGYTISDSIILGAETLSMVLFLTDTPVTWYKRHGANNGRVASICAELEELYYSAEPVKVVTTDNTYKNMAIESITISKSTEVGYAREIPISFRKVRKTSEKETTIPSSYGKSGDTTESSGTASTSTATTSSTTSSDTTSSSSSSSTSSSSSSSSTKSSTLYNVGTALSSLFS